MKFLLIILIVRFVFAVLGSTAKNKVIEEREVMNVKHPAEFGLR